MERTIENLSVKKISAIIKMYPNSDFKIRTNNDNLELSWKDSMPSQVESSKGRKIQRKLDQVRNILGDSFIEFNWLNDRQVVYVKM